MEEVINPKGVCGKFWVVKVYLLEHQPLISKTCFHTNKNLKCYPSYLHKIWTIMYKELCSNGECFSNVIVKTQSYLTLIKNPLYKREYGAENSQMDANIMN